VKQFSVFVSNLHVYISMPLQPKSTYFCYWNFVVKKIDQKNGSMHGKNKAQAKFIDSALKYFTTFKISRSYR